MNTQDAAIWRSKLLELAEGLGKLTPQTFLDMRNGRENISDGLDELAAAFSKDVADWRQFMRAHPQARQNWLPVDPARLGAMTTHEIYYRLRENIADERWVDDALVEPFESGSLFAAIKKIASELSIFELEITPPAQP